MSFIVIDFERSGFEASESARIVEIGAVELTAKGMGRRFHTRVSIPGPMSDHAVALHGLTMEDLIGAPTIDVAWRDFLAWAQGLPLVMHSASNDLAHLAHDLALHGQALEGMATHCSQRFFRKMFHSGMKIGLNSVCDLLGVDRQSRVQHGALLDAELLAECLLRVKARFKDTILEGVVPSGIKITPLVKKSSKSQEKRSPYTRAERAAKNEAHRQQNALEREDNPAVSLIFDPATQEVIFTCHQGNTVAVRVPSYPLDTHQVRINSHGRSAFIHAKDHPNPKPHNPIGPALILLIKGEAVFR